jgi:predicted MFS family arabinose efflux permease
LIADYFPRERRALPLAIFQCGSIAGLSLGLFVIGALGQHLGWRLSLQIAGFAGIPIALLMVFTLREPPRPQPSNATKEPALQALGALLRRPAFVHVALAAGLGMTCSTGMTQWFPSFLIRSFGMSIVQVGAWSGLAVAIGGLAGLLSGGMLTTWLARGHRL